MSKHSSPTRTSASPCSSLTEGNSRAAIQGTCHGHTLAGAPCSSVGVIRPERARFAYCRTHAEKWARFEPVSADGLQSKEVSEAVPSAGAKKRPAVTPCQDEELSPCRKPSESVAKARKVALAQARARRAVATLSQGEEEPPCEKPSGTKTG